MQERCDLCKKICEITIVDGKTKYGPWAWMCRHCHDVHGVGLGLGRGQLWDLQTGKKLKG